MSAANSQSTNAQTSGSQHSNQAGGSSERPETVKLPGRAAGIAAAEQARAELRKTLDQLSYNLDFPARIDDRVNDVKHKIIRQKRRNPVSFVVGVAVLGLAAGAVVAGVSLAIARRL
ncbi:hypothetical protein [Leucobacter sp. OH1287]|uniref:hypothetical protein n=1 Tax=Leucobacter sp. OH1287 TaxID=2491049 RepID=UPI000F5FB221|nr:hypothetical protein [Leucobacter sp. OH1287]RRD60791.1 hypothetical protein EII30_04355 [Leucobacter sp. OH1287]